MFREEAALGTLWRLRARTAGYKRFVPSRTDLMFFPYDFDRCAKPLARMDLTNITSAAVTVADPAELVAAIEQRS